LEEPNGGRVSLALQGYHLNLQSTNEAILFDLVDSLRRYADRLRKPMQADAEQLQVLFQ